MAEFTLTALLIAAVVYVGGQLDLTSIEKDAKDFWKKKGTRRN